MGACSVGLPDLARHAQCAPAGRHGVPQPAVLDCLIWRALRSVHPLGGTAYLSLEDAEEPFAGGVKFTAMPPTKRFRDMEQLSGGEKARSPPSWHSLRESCTPLLCVWGGGHAQHAGRVARVYIRCAHLYIAEKG